MYWQKYLHRYEKFISLFKSDLISFMRTNYAYVMTPLLALSVRWIKFWIYNYAYKSNTLSVKIFALLTSYFIFYWGNLIILMLFHALLSSLKSKKFVLWPITLCLGSWIKRSRGNYEAGKLKVWLLLRKARPALSGRSWKGRPPPVSMSTSSGSISS